MGIVQSVAVLVVSAVVAQSTPASPSKPAAIDTPHLTISTSASVAKASSGAKVLLVVDVAPKSKMHVYAPGEKEGLPVALTVEPDPAIKAGAPQFPPAEKFFFAPLKLTQLVYSHPFRLTVPVTVLRPRAALTIKGTLRYQACDDDVCYRLTSVPVSWTVQIQ